MPNSLLFPVPLRREFDPYAEELSAFSKGCIHPTVALCRRLEEIPDNFPVSREIRPLARETGFARLAPPPPSRTKLT
jgi:hypothetical protein